MERNHTVQSWSDKSDKNSLSPRLYLTDRVFLWAVAYYALLSCGAVLNIMVVFVMARSRKIRKTISSFLTFHLSVTHLLLHLTVPILWNIQLSKGSSSACKALVSIDYACAAAIFNSLVAIAWDRHRNVLRPFLSLVPRHLKTYFKLAAAIWTYAFILLLLLFTALAQALQNFALKRTMARKFVKNIVSVICLQIRKTSYPKQSTFCWRSFFL